MRILHLISTLTNGGAERQLAYLTRELRRRGHDVLQTWFVESDIAGAVASVLTRTPWLLREPNTSAFYHGRVQAWLRKAMANVAVGEMADVYESLYAELSPRKQALDREAIPLGRREQHE